MLSISGKPPKFQVPSFTLSRQIEELREEFINSYIKTVDSGQFVLGENVKNLEDDIARFCEVDYGIGVANGSDALYLAILACGIGNGDEVITTPFTFFATAGAISRTGATPVFVDIDCNTWNLDPNKIEEKITTRTKAIIPVHLYGCPCDMEPISRLASKYQLSVIEDAAQAIGAEYKGRKVGALGDVCCFSFFPTKNLGGFGDGGMVVTHNQEIAEKIRLLRVHGARKKYCHEILGCNSRLDELQAAMLRVKFKYLHDWTVQRREIAQLYNRLFHEIGLCDKMEITLPEEPSNYHHVYHQYTIQIQKRNQLQKKLKLYGVESTVYYPIPLHLQQVFSNLSYNQGDFPIAETASKQVLSLPMFPELKDEEVEYVVEAIAKSLLS